MKKTAFIIAAVVSCTFLFTPAYPQDIGEAIAKLSGETMRCQIILYTMCSYYYLDNGRWPQNKREFEAFFEKTDDKSRKENMDYLSTMASYEFTPLENGDLLIEGGFNEKLTKGPSGVEMFRFSSIAHKTEENISFSPSDKSKQATGNMSLPFKFKTKQEPQGQK